MLGARNALGLFRSSHLACLVATRPVSTSSHEELGKKLFDGLVSNSRADLAKAITLIETTNPVKKKSAQVLLNLILHHLKEKRANNGKPCLRIGITGPPGAGKSSLIETLGTFITKKVGSKISVLTVDPSSTTTGGRPARKELFKSSLTGLSHKLSC